MIEKVSPVFPVRNAKQNQTPMQYNGCSQPKKQQNIKPKTKPDNSLTQQELSAIIYTNHHLDIDISKISSCNKTSMYDCENECPRYHICSTIAYANDILTQYENESVLYNPGKETSYE